MISIAIDGPAGSGKSTIAKILAERLNISYIDSGAFYRALAYKYIKNKLKEEDISSMLKSTKIDYHKGKIILDQEDITAKIRTEEISKGASQISKLKEVRNFVDSNLKAISKSKSVIMEGRDITTVVLKDANYKFYLDANPKSRARRRYEQLKEKAIEADLEEIEKDIIKRDYNDSTRENAPLSISEDSVYIDSSEIDIEETLNIILKEIKRKDV